MANRTSDESPRRIPCDDSPTPGARHDQRQADGELRPAPPAPPEDRRAGGDDGDGPLGWIPGLS